MVDIHVLYQTVQHGKEKTSAQKLQAIRKHLHLRANEIRNISYECEGV